MVWPVNFPSGWLGWFETEVVGQVGKAKCPKNNNKKKSLMHFKTMPQAAGNSQISTGSCVDHQIRRGSKGPPYPKAGKLET